MTNANEVQEAERTLLVKLLTALGDKRVIGAFVTMILALCAYIAYWATSHTAEAVSVVGAGSSDPCCVVQKASKGKEAVPTNVLAKVLWFGCAMSACQPTPQPIPPPVPAVDAGPPAPSVQFPDCNPPTLMAPDPKRIEQYRKSLSPRHKVTGPALFLGLDTAAPVPPVFWASRIPWCGNQANVGACEAFTQLDIATAAPRSLTFATQDAFNVAALEAYKWITRNDPYPGAWPQQDTGSDSLTGCKWLVANGYAKSCRVLSGAAAVKIAIQEGPVISGMNWLDTMFTPDRCGYVSTDGVPQGGHAEGLFGYDPVLDEWFLENHWDQSWGICRNGHCGYHRLTTKQLFSSALDADFVQPVQ